MTHLLVLLLSACGDPPQDTATPPVDAPLENYSPAAECADCHPRQYAEWRQSMHAYAAKSPVFDAMAAKAFRDTSGEVGTFCTGCHTQAGTRAGEPGSTTAATRSDLSLEGITCDFCHSATGHSGPIGNTNIVSEPGMVKVGPYADGTSAYHASAQSDFITSPDFCGSCHDVFKFPGLRIEEAYTEYVVSPAAEEAVRCQDCHMGVTPGVPGERPVGPSAVVEGVPGPDREVTSHAFVGPDYSLIDAFPFPDDLAASAEAQAAYLEKVEVLLSNAGRLRDLSARALAGSESLAVRVDLTLENLISGHGFPTGFTSERQVWIELTITDRDGTVYPVSGDLDAWGDLRDAHSWAVGSGAAARDAQLVNLQSENFVSRHGYDAAGDQLPLMDANDIEESSTIFPFDASSILKNNLEPLEQRPVSYVAELPLEARPPFTVTARLHYRNLPPYLLRALHLDDLVDRLHVFTIDEAQVTINP
ncbi:MAG: cytochrome c family protein [Alphaproteobacteria bacterium]|nr:cytochrome c family protein [Alphaproteobacteria bacterium]